VPNNYCLLTFTFLITILSWNISYDLTNAKYGLHILSLINLLTCFQCASFDLGCNYFPTRICMNLLPYHVMPSPTPSLCSFFLDFCTLYRQPTLFKITWLPFLIWYSYYFNVLLPSIYQSFLVFVFFCSSVFPKIFLERNIILFSNGSLYFPSLFHLFPSLHHIYVVHIMYQSL
jgi:hypothetical protein